MSTITPQERKRIADELGINEQYLYQCLTGRAHMEAKQAAAIEKSTGGVLRRWDVRTKDWHEIWPELIGVEGAPESPITAEAKAAA